MGADSLLNYRATVDAAGVQSVGTQAVSSLLVSVALDAATGGTDPSVTFVVEQLLGDGTTWVAYGDPIVAEVGESGVLAVGPFGAEPTVVTTATRVAWTLTGTVAPDDAAVRISIVGRT